MADIYADIEETREIISLLQDQLPSRSYELSSVQDVKLTEWKDSILNGEMIVEGQLLMLRSIYGGSNLGSIPVICTGVQRKTLDSYEYTLLVLSGDLNNELTTLTLDSSKLTDATDLMTDMAIVVESIKDSVLGFEDFRTLKLKLGIARLYVLDLTNGVYKSFF